MKICGKDSAISFLGGNFAVSSLKQTNENQIRQIRVFISSTFRDMQMERNILVKQIFPQLRKLCEERSVTWTEVDLRWGITTEQSAEGKVLPLCLEEIQRCRPYFIGLLGERYGWVPDSIPEELIQTQSWLQDHSNSSITELEILHGVFTETTAYKHAFFYFRDPNYLERLPEEERDEFEEDSEAAEKLIKLKRKIRHEANNNFCNLRENYNKPEELGEWILEDFTNLINDLYPKEKTLDTLTQEATWHETQARNRQLAFIGRDDIIKRLNEHIQDNGGPLVIVGESGCGKSSLIAEWVRRWREFNNDDVVIQHYIGSTSNGADWQSLVKRILNELKRSFHLEDKIPEDADTLRGALADWAAKVVGQKKIFLVLDALNQLEDDPIAKQISWLPDYFPSNFRVVVTSLPSDSLDILRKRKYHEIELPLFTTDEIESATIAFFRIFSKTPSARMIKDLKSTEAARNPLFLRSVLDELRQFGQHDEIDNKLQNYLSARNPAELFDRIITRWENDFGQNNEFPGIVQDTLALIACSRFGLSESEILDLLGQNQHPMPHRFWTPFYLAIENALSQNNGLLRVGHHYLQNAIEIRFLNKMEAKKRYQLNIADYFSMRDLSHRVASELPWQFKQSFEKNRLRSVLLNIPLALEILRRSTNELLSYWVWLQEEHSIGQLYVDFIQSSSAELKWTPQITSENATAIAEFLTQAGAYSHAGELYHYALDIDEKIGQRNSLNTAVKLIRMSDLLLLMQKPIEVEIRLLRAIDILDEKLFREVPLLIQALINLAAAQESTGRLEHAEKHCRRALQLAENHYGSNSELTANCLGQLGELLLGDSIRFTEMERLLRSERKQSHHHVEAESFFRRALEIHKEIKGEDHPEVAYDLHRISMCLIRRNRLGEAELAIEEALFIIEKAFGNNHPYLANLHSTYADILELCGLKDEASKHKSRSENVQDKMRDNMNFVDGFNAIFGFIDLSKWAFISTLPGRLVIKFTRTCFRLTGTPLPIWLNDLAEYERLDHLLVEKKSNWQRIYEWASTGLSIVQVIIHLLVVLNVIKEGLINRNFSSILAVFFTLVMHMAQIWGIIIVDLFWSYNWLPSNFAKWVLVLTIIYAVREIFDRIVKK